MWGCEPMSVAAQLELSGLVDKSAVEQLFAAIVTSLKAAKTIVIDGTGIESIDLEALSTLCGIHRHVTGRGQTLRIEGVYPRIIDAAISGNRGFAPWTFCSINNKATCLWARN